MCGQDTCERLDGGGRRLKNREAEKEEERGQMMVLMD